MERQAGQRYDGAMLEVTFTSPNHPPFICTVPIGSAGGGDAMEQASAAYRANVDPTWTPGAKGVVVTIKGV